MKNNLSLEQRIFNASKEGQRKMFNDASHNAATQMLSKQLEKLTSERFALVKAWREGGKTDELWTIVETHDAKMKPIEDELSSRI